jgi:hypothetical protein
VNDSGTGGHWNRSRRQIGNSGCIRLAQAGQVFVKATEHNRPTDSRIPPTATLNSRLVTVAPRKMGSGSMFFHSKV